MVLQRKGSGLIREGEWSHKGEWSYKGRGVVSQRKGRGLKGEWSYKGRGVVSQRKGSGLTKENTAALSQDTRLTCANCRWAGDWEAVAVAATFECSCFCITCRPAESTVTSPGGGASMIKTVDARKVSSG